MPLVSVHFWGLLAARSCKLESGIYSIKSPGWQSSKLHSLSMLSQFRPSPRRSFCNVDSASLFSFLILLVFHPFSFNRVSTSTFHRKPMLASLLKCLLLGLSLNIVFSIIHEIKCKYCTKMIARTIV